MTANVARPRVALRKAKGVLQVTALVTGIAGGVFGIGEYEARRLEATRAQARAGYQELLGNLGSSNTVLRVGAIKQIGSVITHDIPLEDGGGLGRNLGYFVGLVRPSVGNPYHDDLLRAIALLVGAPRSPGVDGRLE